MIRTALFSLTLSSLLALLALPLSAEAPSEAVSPEAPQQTEYRMVRDSFEHIQFLTDNKPNPHAKYYLYLISASWCGPCRAEMPHIVEAYPRMKKGNHMEVILVGADRTEEGVKKYLDMFDAPFPALMHGSEDAKKLPGCPERVSAVPTLVIVNAKGEEIASGHGEIFDNWENLTGKKSDRKKGQNASERKKRETKGNKRDRSQR